jgi:hypothetical protein
MEYGEQIVCNDINNVDVQQSTNVCKELCDNNYTRYVGWRENNPCIAKYFSPDTVNLISRKITQLLQGIDQKNRPILIPNSSICNIMSTVYSNFRPQTGDMYSRYIIPTDNQQSYVQNMIDQVIEIIVSQVKSELGFQQNNAKLTKWTTVLGNFNKHGLNQTPPIKVLQKRPTPMQFNMQY